MNDDEAKLSEFYMELCNKLTISELDELINALSKGYDSKLFSVYGWGSNGITFINTTQDLISLINAAKKYKNASDTEKNQIVAQNLGTFLSLGSNITSFSGIGYHFSLMFDIASSCLNKGLELVNRRISVQIPAY